MQAIAEAVIPKVLSLAEIKAKIERARDRKFYRRTDEVKKEIADLKGELELSRKREESAIVQKNAYQTDLAEHRAALKEINEHKEYLIAGGDDPARLAADLEIVIKDLLAKIDSTTTSLFEVSRATVEIERRTAALQAELETIELAKREDEKKKPPSDDFMPGNTIETARPETPKPEAQFKNPFYYNNAYRTILQHMPTCREDIKRLFDAAEKLPKKFDAYSHDKNIRGLIMTVHASEAKILLIERFHEMSDNEMYVARNILNALRNMAKAYETGVIEALSSGERPRGFTNWYEYHKDAKKQLQNYLKPLPSVEEKKGIFGVVAPAPAPTPTLTAVAIQALQPLIKIAPPSIFVEKEEVEDYANGKAKPKKERQPPAKVESLEHRIVRLVKESGVTKQTSGMRVAVVAGQADKNKPVAELFEKAFEFKRVRWYDNDCGHLINSIKVGGIDLLIAIPDWHRGYMEYVSFAKNKGIGTEIMNGHNKKLMIQQLCSHYGVNILIPD